MFPSFVYSFIHLFIHSFICLFIHSFVYSFMHSSISCYQGYTRGFGFVEFDTVESAKQWMDHIKVSLIVYTLFHAYWSIELNRIPCCYYNQGRLICQGFSIGADYSRPKNAQDKDWNCPKVSYHVVVITSSFTLQSAR